MLSSLPVGAQTEVERPADQLETSFTAQLRPSQPPAGQAKVLFLEESLLHSCAQPVVAAEKAMF